MREFFQPLLAHFTPQNLLRSIDSAHSSGQSKWKSTWQQRNLYISRPENRQKTFNLTANKVKKGESIENKNFSDHFHIPEDEFSILYIIESSHHVKCSKFYLSCDLIKLQLGMHIIHETDHFHSNTMVPLHIDPLPIPLLSLPLQ